MNKEEYATYLQSDHWKKVKKAMYSMKSRCHVCFIGEENLNIHHITYENIGNEGYFDLVVLCQDCHKKIHREKTELKKFCNSKSEMVRERAFFFMVYCDYGNREAMDEAKRQIYEKHGEPEILNMKSIIPDVLRDILENNPHLKEDNKNVKA